MVMLNIPAPNATTRDYEQGFGSFENVLKD
jgi:hypothetical protein